MAQINLLKQTATRQPVADIVYRIIFFFFLAVLLGVFAYYGYLVFDTHKIDSKATSLQLKMAQESSASYNNPRRNELLTRQLQLKDLNSLIAGHVYWSQLFPVLAKVTLKNASYESVTIIPETNSITLTAQVPSLTDLDKYMQVFDLPQFYKYFSEVRIASFNQTQTQSGNTVRFSVEMNYDPTLVQFGSTSDN